MARRSAGEIIAPLIMTSIHGSTVPIPHSDQQTHIQFRRFAGCPVCNRHLQSFIRCHEAVRDAGIHEVVVFHSTPESLLAHQATAPFAMIADPTRSWYRLFGVEASPWALLHPLAWPAALAGIFRHGMALPGRGESVIGLPADVLIDRDGRIRALKYGRHADDQWSVDEVLALATGAE